MEKQLRKNVLFNTAGSLLFYICQAAINLLVVALAGMDANGMLGVAMTAANVCVSFASYGMRTFQVSDLAHKYTDRTYLWSRQLTVAAAWLGALAFAFINSYSAQQRWVIVLFTGYRLVESWSDVWHGYLQRAERIDLVGVSFGVRGILTAGIIALGLLITHDLVLTVGVLFALNAVYVLAVDLPLAKKRADLAQTGGGSVWALLLECLPLAVYAALNTSIASTPRYYCERLLGETQLGYFTSVFLPVLILQVAVVYLFVPFITLFAKLWANKDKTSYFKGVKVLFICLAAVWAAGAGGVALLGKWGLGFLYPTTPEILQFAPLLQPLVICCVVTVLATVLCNLLTIAREMRGLICGCALGLVVALAASPALITAFGVWGAAWATLAGIGAQSLALLLFLLHRCKKQFG